MAEPFKNFIDENVVTQIGQQLHRCWPDFAHKRFKQLALAGLETLELKQRVAHVAKALGQTLPTDFDQAATLIEASLAPETHATSMAAQNSGADGLAGWAIWPLTHYIEEHGLAHPQRALQALHALTKRFSAEFALRPFLLQHPQLTLATLERWLDDPNPHVRRLISEGTRPRLPWGMRLTPFIKDPSPCLPLLDALVDDESEYVRRSVANHLNDISKDHPALALEIATRWLERHNDNRTLKLVKHGLRGLIKHGNGAALRLLGFDHGGEIEVTTLPLKPKRLKEGDTLHFGVRIHNPGKTSLRLSIDYAIHYLKANGKHSAKVFKWRKCELAAAETMTLTGKHHIKRVTTRRHYAGEQMLDVRINGSIYEAQRFMLLLDAAKT